MMRLHVQYLTDEKGERTAAVVPISDFVELLECAQDVVDVKLMDEARGEPRVSWEKTKQARRARGKKAPATRSS